MATKKILIIEDEKNQADALGLTIQEIFPDAELFIASEEKEMHEFIESKFYNLAILDIRMDLYNTDGIELAKKIIEINPFCKILFVSRFLAEYMNDLQELFTTGNTLGFSEKKNYDTWTPELKEKIEKYYELLDEDPYQVNGVLLKYYANAKNESNILKKGKAFEDFITILFRSIGFSEVMKRVKDISLNEVDLIIRNDIDDSFLSKFGKYILVECKNKPEQKTDKNDFIVFVSKLENSNKLAELGFIFTTSTVTRNTYIEAARQSKANAKVIIIDNKLMLELLTFSDLKEGLKKIIDNQVKSN